MTDLVFVVRDGAMLHVFNDGCQETADYVSPVGHAVAMDAWTAEPIIDDALADRQRVFLWEMGTRGVALPRRIYS